LIEFVAQRLIKVEAMLDYRNRGMGAGANPARSKVSPSLSGSSRLLSGQLALSPSLTSLSSDATSLSFGLSAGSRLIEVPGLWLMNR
jgi:hypothetical protein